MFGGRLLPLYVPPWTWSIPQIITVVFVPCIPLFFATEGFQLFSFGYSKFADRAARWKLPSRLGMFLLYFPAVFVGPGLLFGLRGPIDGWHLLAVGLVSAHFAKRCLEVLFLHKYSGFTNGFSTVAISSLYATLSGLVGALAATELQPALVSAPPFTTWLVPGLVLWTLGQGGNLYHHWLLANLRKPGETDYKVPKGGLFGLVACPHYLFELVGWLGFSLVFQHVTAWVLLGTMSGYLFGRSRATLGWYKERLGDRLPAGWRGVVPFVY